MLLYVVKLNLVIWKFAAFAAFLIQLEGGGGDMTHRYCRARSQ